MIVKFDKQVFIALLSFSELLATKCTFLSNKPCLAISLWLV